MLATDWFNNENFIHSQYYLTGVDSVYLNAAEDTSSLQDLIKKSDVVVSILPANLHPIVAKACINEGIHMVTASYMSNEIKDLHQAAQSAGVTILNEVGLDPGEYLSG